MALAIRIAVLVGIVAVLATPPLALGHVPDEPPGSMICGTWTYYAPGKMERVRDVVRKLSRCEDCDGIATTVDQSLLDKRITIWYGGQWRGTYHVVDVGKPGINRPDLVGEVTAEVAWEWGRAGPWWGCYRVVT